MGYTLEELVGIFHDNFKSLRFIVPRNARSAATLMAFSCESILMGPRATLGPFDPQLGRSTYSYLQGFERAKEELADKGADAFAKFLANYDMAFLELCRQAEDFARRLAKEWLSKYMFPEKPTDHPDIKSIVDYFADASIHQSHSRAINRETCMEKGLKIKKLEDDPILDRLVTSLVNQYHMLFDHTTMYKIYETMYAPGRARLWPVDHMKDA